MSNPRETRLKRINDQDLVELIPIYDQQDPRKLPYSYFLDDLLDHVIILGEAHLRRLVRDYIRYYHADRTHDGLGKDTPDRRPVERRKSPKTELVPLPRLGGLHHR